MGRNEKIVVSAIDPLSIKDKKEGYEQAEFILRHKQQLQQLQQQSGVPMISQDAFVPEDKEDLELWAAHYQRTPEEILTETWTNDMFSTNGFFDSVKDKLLHDSGETGLVGIYIEMDENGYVIPEWIKAENILYSYSEYDDLRDTAWRGRVKSLKISDLRKKYGKEFGGKLTEEEIFEIAKGAKEYQMGDKIMWIYEWTVAFLRPYDEWNVDIIEFELRSLDHDPYTIVTTKKNKSTIVKNGTPNKPSDNEEYGTEKIENIYRGVFTRYSRKLLEWKLKPNMIRSSDHKSQNKAEFSYSIFMYQNFDMRNIAIPERIEEPMEMLVMIRLKMQQLIAKMRPPGAAINEDALQEIDYGLGEAGNDGVDHKRMYDQTGDIYYRGRDAEGNPIPVPIVELQNSGFLPQMQGLIAQYDFQMRVVRDELGQDPNLLSQASRPRVAEGNVQVAMQEADNSTSHMYDAYLYVMEETARKAACLFRDSVTFGAEAYRHIVKDEDMGNRAFSTKTQMLPVDAEIQVLNDMLTEAIRSSPDILMYIDTFKVQRMAREDVKLAEIYFRRCMRRMLQAKQQQEQQNQQANIQSQIQSAQSKSDGDARIAQLKGDLELRNSSVIGLLAIYQKGPMPPELQTFAQAVFQNVYFPTVADTEQQKQLISGMAQQQQNQAQQAQPQQQLATPQMQQQ